MDIDTTSLTVRVVFRTLHDVLLKQRTDFQPSTKYYLQSAQEIFRVTADTLRDIADQRVPASVGADPAQRYLVNSTELLVRTTHAASDFRSSPDQLRRCAASFGEYADLVGTLLTSPQDTYKEARELAGELQRFAGALTQAITESDPLLDPVEAAVG